MVFDQLGPETADRPTDRGDEVQNVAAGGVGLWRGFDRLDLALQPANAGDEL